MNNIGNIETITLSPTLSIWKSSLNTIDNCDVITECEVVIKNLPNIKTDAYPCYMNTDLVYKDFINLTPKNKLELIIKHGIGLCVQLHNKPFTKIKTNAWINIVRSKNPVQRKFSLKRNGELLTFHKHTELNLLNGLFPPNYTFIFYIQMPNNLINDDGVLFLKDDENMIYSVLPKEGDLLIISGDTLHVPNYAFNSDKDRIVLAGNVSFVNEINLI